MKRLLPTDLKLLRNIFVPKGKTFAFHQRDYSQVKRPKRNILDIPKHGTEYIISFGSPRNVPGYHKLELRYFGSKHRPMRWVFPKGHLTTALTFYSADSIRAMVIKKMLTFSDHIGLSRLFTRRVTIYHRSKLEIERKLSGTNFETYVIFMGTPGMHRTAVAGLINHNRITSYAKLAFDETSMAQIAQERHQLFKLSFKEFQNIKFPKLHELTDRSILLASDLYEPKAQRFNTFQPQHDKALEELFETTKASYRLDDSQYFEQIMSNLRNIREEIKGFKNKRVNRLFIQLEKHFDQIPYQTRYLSCLAHGDFTPWNMYLTKDRVLLYDWELSSPSAPFLYDLFHFHFQSGIFLKGQNFDQIRYEIDDSLKSKGIQRILDTYRPDTEILLRLYLMHVSSERIVHILKTGVLNFDDKRLCKVWENAFKSLSPEMAGDDRAIFIEDFNRYLSCFNHAYLKFNAPNIRQLPKTSDLDIAIDKPYAKRLIDFCKEHESIRKVRSYTKSFMNTVEVYFGDGGFLSIDLIHSFKRRHLNMMPIAPLLNSAHYCQDRLVYIPDTCFDLEYALLFYYLNHAVVPEKYIELFDSINVGNERRCVNYMNRKYKLNIERFQELFEGERVAHLIRKAVKKRNHRVFGVWIQSTYRYLGDTIKGLFQRKGFIITISGVDGVGKTSVIKRVHEQISSVYRRDTVLLRHRPKVLPILSSLKYGSVKKAEENATEKAPGDASDRSWISSAARFAYYYMDYLLGSAYVYLRYVARGKIVIYDRYYFDFINHPERSNLKVNRRLAKSLYRLIQKPRLNILLHATSEEILSRKQELDGASIKRLNSGYKALFKEFSQKYPRSNYVLQKNDDIETTTNNILKEFQRVA